MKKGKKLEKYALMILRKWLRKGNMARAMRDVLPSSGLSLKEREKVARIVHNIVRYKRYYDFIIESKNMKRVAESYISISKKKFQVDVPEDVLYSFSPQLFEVTPREFIPIINREPDTTLCVNLNRISGEEAIEKLKEEGFRAREYIPESAVITDPGGRYSSLVKGGLAIVQDASSQIVAKISGALGDRILDYCAGSGGKSLAMYSLYPDKKYYAYDINEGKLKSLKKRAEGWGMDVEIFWKEPDGKFSVVLVDAPCSGVGAAARNPEAKYQTDFWKYSDIQVDIVNNALKYVENNGFLVYVVCSYTPQETDEVIERILDMGNLEIVDVEIPYREYVKNGRLGAYIFAGDIFYISVLRRA